MGLLDDLVRVISGVGESVGGVIEGVIEGATDVVGGIFQGSSSTNNQNSVTQAYNQSVATQQRLIQQQESYRQRRIQSIQELFSTIPTDYVFIDTDDQPNWWW